MSKEKFLFSAAKGFAFIAPIYYCLESLSMQLSLFTDLIFLVILVALLALIFSYLNMERKKEWEVLRSLILGSGLGLILLAGIPQLKVFPILIWLVILLGTTGKVFSYKIKREETLKFSSFLRLFIIMIPVLGIFYYFGTQSIWLMSASFVLVFASQQKKDLRESPSARFKCLKVSVLAIIVGLMSSVFQYSHLAIDWMMDSISSLGAGTVVIVGFIILVLATLFFAAYFHKKEIVKAEREEKERQLAQQKERDEARKDLEDKKNLLKKSILIGKDIKFEDYVIVSNIKYQIVYNESARLLLSTLDSMVASSFNDSELAIAISILEDMLTHIENKKTNSQILYKGEEELRSQINGTLKRIPKLRNH